MRERKKQDATAAAVISIIDSIDVSAVPQEKHAYEVKDD